MVGLDGGESHGSTLNIILPLRIQTPPDRIGLRVPYNRNVGVIPVIPFYLVNLYGKLVGKYTSPMEQMGMVTFPYL